MTFRRRAESPRHGGAPGRSSSRATWRRNDARRACADAAVVEREPGERDGERCVDPRIGQYHDRPAGERGRSTGLKRSRNARSRAQRRPAVTSEQPHGRLAPAQPGQEPIGCPRVAEEEAGLPGISRVGPGDPMPEIRQHGASRSSSRPMESKSRVRLSARANVASRRAALCSDPEPDAAARGEERRLLELLGPAPVREAVGRPLRARPGCDLDGSRRRSRRHRAGLDAPRTPGRKANPLRQVGALPPRVHRSRRGLHSCDCGSRREPEQRAKSCETQVVVLRRDTLPGRVPPRPPGQSRPRVAQAGVSSNGVPSRRARCDTSVTRVAPTGQHLARTGARRVTPSERPVRTSPHSSLRVGRRDAGSGASYHKHRGDGPRGAWNGLLVAALDDAIARERRARDCAGLEQRWTRGRSAALGHTRGRARRVALGDTRGAPPRIEARLVLRDEITSRR